MSRTRRDGLKDSLAEGLREQASRAVLLHGLIAERAGLGPTDIKALDLARDADELTAGHLARLTGLSNSATTALLDRLERRGYVERHSDVSDRRKVVVTLTGKLDDTLREVFLGMLELVNETLDAYNEDELELLSGFVAQLNAAAAGFTQRLAKPQRKAGEP